MMRVKQNWKLEHSPTSQSDAGFTLVEVLVALAIFSIAVVALVNAQTENVRTVAILEERAIAEIVAENQLIETLTDPRTLDVGFTSGDAIFAERAYEWRRQIIETGNPAVHRVEINVYPEGSTQSLASLSALRKAD